MLRSVAGGPVVHYLFDVSGKPLAEHDGTTGAVLREYIWICDLMVGWSDGTGLSFVHGGHLGQPLAMTDAAGAVVWRAEFGPFGELLPSVTTQENELRFPGQWADGESKLLQNWHRDYDASLGRYIQADPIGLAAGQSLYGYVGGDPVNFVDPMGLERDYADRFSRIQQQHRDAVNYWQIQDLGRGWEIIPGEIRVPFPSLGLVRVYDYAVQDPTTGQVCGVEVKSTYTGRYRLKSNQVACDTAVYTSANPIIASNELVISCVGYRGAFFGPGSQWDAYWSSRVLARTLEAAGIELEGTMYPVGTN